MTKNILITRAIPDIAVSMLRAEGYVVDVNPVDKVLTQEEVINLLKQKPYDGVITQLTDKIDSVVFESAPTVKIFANYASGFDNINLVDAKAHNVVVVNAPTDLSSEAVAQHTVGLMFAIGKRIVEADKFVKEGKYEGWAPMHFMGMNLSGKTLGIIGTGRIGERVANFCKGLGLKIIYNDVAQNAEFDKKYEAVYYKSLEEFLPEADFVSIHVPLLPSTKHLINAEKLALMKPTSFLINTSRGPVVDEEALVQALENKVIAGACLDVFEFDPKITPGLLTLPNVVLTPHIASSSLDAREAMSEMVALGVIDFFNGHEPRNKVNQ